MQLFKKSDLVNVFNYADLYVHPARVELEGIACLEAICCGCPTIVSDSKKSATKGFAVDDRCIFKNNNSSDLAKKIDFFLENEDLRKEIGDKYFQSAKQYNQTTCMDEMEKMFIETIKNHKKKN